MLAVAARWFLALSLCPLMGASLAAFYATGLTLDDRLRLGAWLAGLLVGLSYCIGVLILARLRPGCRSRRGADMVLSALALVALADFVGQLMRQTVPWAVHAAALVYAGGFLVVWRGLLRGTSV